LYFLFFTLLLLLPASPPPAHCRCCTVPPFSTRPSSYTPTLCPRAVLSMHRGKTEQSFLFSISFRFLISFAFLCFSPVSRYHSVSTRTMSMMYPPSILASLQAAGQATSVGAVPGSAAPSTAPQGVPLPDVTSVPTPVLAVESSVNVVPGGIASGAEGHGDPACIMDCM
jgi:hypothetical protein